MVAEALGSSTIQQYIKWEDDFEPLWITVDSQSEQGASSPHAKILVQIDGDDDPTGANTINCRPDKWDSKGSYPEVGVINPAWNSFLYSDP